MYNEMKLRYVAIWGRINRVFGQSTSEIAVRYLTKSSTPMSTSGNGSILSKPMPERPARMDLSPYTEVMKDFVQSMSYEWSRSRPVTRNLELERRVTRNFEEQFAKGELTHEDLASIRELIVAVSHFAELCYFDLPLEIKVFISTYGTLVHFIDDLCSDDPEKILPELQSCIPNWGNVSQTKLHPLLDYFHLITTSELPKYYGPVGTTNIIHATFGFIAGCVLEARYPEGVTCPATATRFPKYLRRKAGISEPFSLFIFPEEIFPEEEYLESYLPAVPDIQHFTDVTNDIYSFYKENVVGNEPNTYIMSTSRVRRCSPLDVWRDMCRRQTRQEEEISATLSIREELQKAWERYRVGYHIWHLTQKRYMMQELGVQFAEETEEDTGNWRLDVARGENDSNILTYI